MTAAPLKSVDELDALGEYMSNIIGPQVTYAVARKDADRVAELLTPLSTVDLRALVVALAERCPRPSLRPEDGQVDEIAIRRAAAGDAVLLTRTERDLAIHLMDRRGIGVETIRKRFHMSVTSVRLVLNTPAPVQTDLLTEGATA